MIRIREAREEDVGQIREIFLAVYGTDYPHRELYDELWLKRSVFTDDALILVAEDQDAGRVVGTASVLFDFGAHSDLVGEFGRLAVHSNIACLMGFFLTFVKKEYRSLDRISIHPSFSCLNLSIP